MITFAVFTCNRLHYLKNCVSSILEFVDLEDVNLLIVDSCTVEDGFNDYISSLPGWIDIQVYPERSPNELYRSMNFAIKYAKKKGDKYIYFVQDDYQFLYKNPNLVRVVDEAFSAKKKVGQVQLNMGWKAKRKKLGKVTLENINGTLWNLCHQKHVCDNGFTRVALYDKIGLYPENVSMYGDADGFKGKGEDWVAKKTSHLKRLMLCESNIGMMIDCAYVRKNKRYGKYFPPPKKFYLKPFDENTVMMMQRSASEGKMAFIEDWVRPDGWEPESMGKHSTDSSVMILEK